MDLTEPGAGSDLLGIHGSPTCDVVFDGAIGTRLGQKGRGFKAMLDLMNTARLGVAAQAVGLSEAAIHVGHYLAEALLESGIDVVPAHDSKGILAELTRTTDLHRDASRLTRAAVERLDVDALLVVEVTRWLPRDTLRRPPSPAAVGFRATLHGGSAGLLLWSGEFSERQVSFFESPWRSLRYPGRGTRWLSALELARWGSRRLVDQIPIGSVER